MSEAEIAALREEILRLRAEVEKLKEAELIFSKDGQRWRTAINIFEEQKAEIEKLRAALKNLVVDVQDYENVNNLYPNPGKTHCWESVRAAAAAIREGGGDD